MLMVGHWKLIETWAATESTFQNKNQLVLLLIWLVECSLKLEQYESAE